MHRGQRANLRNRTDPAIKAGYKAAADFFTTRHKFFLLSGRHPYKPLLLAAEGDELVVATVAAAQPQEAVGQDAGT
jgi:hypothetical protein